MNLTGKLIILADKLDRLDLSKYGDALDQIIHKIIRAEDDILVRRQMTQIPENYEILSPIKNATDDDPFDDQLLQDEPGDEPYKGLSLKKKLQERPSAMPSGPMSDEELEELRIKENKKEELRDKVNDLIEWHQQTDGLVEDPRSAQRIEEELRLAIENALADDIIDEDYAKLLNNSLDEMITLPEYFEEENDANDGLIDALKDAADKAPQALKKVLELVKDNPELMRLALEML